MKYNKLKVGPPHKEHFFDLRPETHLLVHKKYRSVTAQNQVIGDRPLSEIVTTRYLEVEVLHLTSHSALGSQDVSAE